MKTLRYLFRAWKARRRNERHEVAAMRERVRPGDTVLDIGAHKGAYLYWLRRAVGPDGRVIAFEPQPALAAYLRDIVGRMGWRNVAVENRGVSDRPGTLTLHIPGGPGATSPGASFEAAVTGRGAPCETVPIPVVSLDAFLPAGAKVSFIKLDVEGHELAVFRGAERLLREAGPAILFECEARHLGGRPVSDVFAVLEGFGYAGRFFAPDGLRPLAEFRPEVHQAADGDRFWDRPGYCNNFLFEKR